MAIKAFVDIREEDIFDICFFVHKVVGFSKVVIIDGVRASIRLYSLFEKISTQFKSINVMKNTEVVMLAIGGTYILGERDCKSTILDLLNKDMYLEIGRYRCQLFVNLQEIVLSFPKCAASNYPVTPNVVEIDKYFDIRACDFKWLKCAMDPKSEQTMNWIEVGTSYVYVPKPDDCGHFLKFICTPKTEEGKAKSMVAVASSPVICGVPKPTHLTERCTNTTEQLKGSSFRIVSYNVLADVYAKKSEDRGELFYCPYYALDLTYRMELVLSELAGYNADVICLQELDNYAYCHMFRKFFEKRGYNGIFSMKHPNIHEGLACFYRTAKFRLCESTYILFPKEMFCKNSIFRYLCAEVCKNKNYAAAFKRNQNSLLCAVLEMVGDLPQYLIVGNTHLLCGPESAHVRLMQAAMVVDYLQHLIMKYKQEVPNAQLASLLCGDMNSLPNSNVYKFLTTGHLSADCPDWCSKKGEEFEGVPLLHELSLKSAYDNLSYTNYVPDFKGCIDYIFYGSDNLQLVQTIPLPSEELLKAEFALPSLTFPSDHLALIADFKWQLDVAARDSSTTSCLQASSEGKSTVVRQAVPRASRRGRSGRSRNVRST